MAAPATAARFKSSSTTVMFEQAKHAAYWRTLSPHTSTFDGCGDTNRGGPGRQLVSPAMAANPLTDPNWAPELADTVERLVGTVRDRATKPAVRAARAIVFGLLAAMLAVVAITLLLIAATRAVQALLDLGLDWSVAVYLSYFIVGGILCLVGLLLLGRRPPPDA
jgi:hypothetical protein